MKTASMVLGIIGGVLAVILALVYIFAGALADTFAGSTDKLNNTFNELSEIAEDQNWDYVEADIDFDFGELNTSYNEAVSAAITWMYIASALGIVGAILGIVGGALVKKKNIVSGVLLIIAAVATIFVPVGFICTILFVLAAIFALIPDKKTVETA